MIAADQQQFGETLRTLCAVHRIQYTSDMFKGYWESLKDMDRAQFFAAVKYLQQNAKWMPKPAEFWAHSRRGWM
jgi:hypothetical protein